MNLSEPTFVTLRNGTVLPIAPMLLALDLERRGLRLGIEGEALTVGPKERITEQDRQQIRRWRDHLKFIANYDAPELVQ